MDSVCRVCGKRYDEDGCRTTLIAGIGEEIEYFTCSNCEMEECGTAVKEELEPEDMTNELKEALDDQKRNHTVFVEVEEEVAV